MPHRGLQHRRLPRYSRPYLSVWTINGAAVRSLFKRDFIQGGHDRVYSWIPRNEVWIETHLSPRNRLLVLCHELFERYLMGRGRSYAWAHRAAEQFEFSALRHLSMPKLRQRVDELITRNT